jgi:hypothetical protein
MVGHESGYLGNRAVEFRLDLYGSGQGPMTGFCERCNELSGSIGDGEFLD